MQGSHCHAGDVHFLCAMCRQEIRARRLAKEAKASLAVAENLYYLGLDKWRTLIRSA